MRDNAREHYTKKKWHKEGKDGDDKQKNDLFIVRKR